MIGVIFELATEIVEVRVDGNNVYFRTPSTNGFGTIENLQLNKVGVIREFPDLKDNEEWRKEAIKRFKEKVKSYNTEMEKVNYIIEDLSKHGYKPKAIQRQGFRPQRIK